MNFRSEKSKRFPLLSLRRGTVKKKRRLCRQDSSGLLPLAAELKRTLWSQSRR